MMAYNCDLSRFLSVISEEGIMYTGDIRNHTTTNKLYKIYPT